jgi:CDP-diacylglycerol--glycerol-3-phosphate 3-phosphatidyltransferase/cardiolipin synthase
MTIPTSLTLFRIALIPVFVLVFYLPWDQARLWTVIIFTLAAVTDWLDGYLARRLNQTSAFGAFLDPVADKLMVAVALVLLLEASPSPGLAIPAAVIIGREIAVSALRERMAEMGQGSAVAVNMAGKIKTTCQMIAIILLLYGEPLGIFPTNAAGYVLLYVAAALTLWSLFIYLARAWPTLRRSAGGA